MKCFEQKEEFKTISFKDDKGRRIEVKIDWSIHSKGTQFLNIDVLDEAKIGDDDEEIYSTEINLNENYGFVSNK